MRRNEKGILSKRDLVFVLILLLIIGLSISPSFGEEGKKVTYGLGILGGFRTASPKLNHYAILPRIDGSLHRNWDLEFEGNFSYYAISDSQNLYLLGLNTNIIFKPIRWNRGFLFLIGGAGLAYNNNSDDNRRVRDIGDSHIAGILQIGSGIQYLGSSPFFGGNTKFSPYFLDNGY